MYYLAALSQEAHHPWNKGPKLIIVKECYYEYEVVIGKISTNNKFAKGSVVDIKIYPTKIPIKKLPTQKNPNLKKLFLQYTDY